MLLGDVQTPAAPLLLSIQTMATNETKTAAPTTDEAEEIAKASEVSKTMDQELLQALTFSPPFLVGWSLGYVRDIQMGAILSLMLMPLCVEKAVSSLGGKGAWNKGMKTAVDKYVKPLWLPRSVWLGPMISIFYFTGEGANPLYTAAICACVYASLVVGNYFIGATAPRPEVKESKEKKKPKEKTPSDKSATGSAKKRS